MRRCRDSPLMSWPASKPAIHGSVPDGWPGREVCPPTALRAVRGAMTSWITGLPGRRRAGALDTHMNGSVLHQRGAFAGGSDPSGIKREGSTLTKLSQMERAVNFLE